MNVWLNAIRPKTLVAGAAPVILASALAVADHVFVWWVGLLALTCAVLIQIASNFINELEDFNRGADTERVGPLRAVSAGLITPAAMKRASWIVVAAAFVLGQPLVWYAGWPVLAIGVVCLVMSWAYTGGPFPLAYKGLGDLFAFTFFGVVAVVGAFFVYSRTWSPDALILSLGPGCLAANILGVNNLRDIPTDKRAGKITLAVRIGAPAARVLYVVLNVVGIVIPALLLREARGPWMMLSLASLPYAIVLCVLIHRRTGAALNPVLGGTALLYLQYTVFTTLGLIFSASYRG